MYSPTSLYSDEDCLMISAIQHYVFCPRQWQLIHMEMEWQDNDLTALGQILHHRVDDPDLPQQREETITLRSVPLVSHRLGLYGVSDIVELTPTVGETYLRHPRYPGRWQATPVEYKRGRPKKHNADKLQLCAEALCLEEMRIYLVDRFVLSLINNRQVAPWDFIVQGENGYLLKDEKRKELLTEWQKRKRTEITHPYLGEKMPIGLLPYIQATLLVRYLRGEIDDYPAFLMT